MRGGRNSAGRGPRSKRSRNGSDVDAREERRRARSAAAEQASSNPPPNESEPVVGPNDGLMCACCNEAIANTDDHVIITASAEHVMCAQILYVRGRNEHCCHVESCNNPITSGFRCMRILHVLHRRLTVLGRVKDYNERSKNSSEIGGQTCNYNKRIRSKKPRE